MEPLFMGCCGCKELADIQNAEDSRDVLGQLYQGDNYDDIDHKTGRFFIFTQADVPTGKNGRFLNFKYGYDLAAYIRKNKLGSVVNAGSGVNPNSNNRITVWVWKIDTDAFETWASKQTFRDPERNVPDNYDDDLNDALTVDPPAPPVPVFHEITFGMSPL